MNLNFHIHKTTDNTGTKTNIKLFSGKNTKINKSHDQKKMGILKKALFAFIALHVFIYATYYIETAIEEYNTRAEITYEHKAIENPYEFNKDCYINENYYSTYEKEYIVNAAKLLYQKTGIQYYRIEIDLTQSGCKTETDVDAYIKDYIDQNISSKDYSLIFVYTNSIESELNEDGYMDYIGHRAEFIVGNKADDFLDYEAMQLLREYFKKYDCDWDSKKLGKCFEKFIDETINFERKQTTKTVTTVFVVVLIIGIIAGCIAYVLYKKHIENTIRILNTPIEDLEEDALKDKYLSNEETKEKEDAPWK